MFGVALSKPLVGVFDTADIAAGGAALFLAVLFVQSHS